MARAKPKKKKTTTVQKKHLVQLVELNIEAPVDEMFHQRRQMYLMVNLIAKRGRELNRGEPALAEIDQPHTTTQLAMAELDSGKLKLRRKTTSKVLVNLIENDA